jgi:branched-chain amino acid transport system substrate-binding protein
MRRPVELRLLDDGGSPGRAALLAEKLIGSDGVDFMLGTYQNAAVMAQSAVAEQYGVPYVNGGGAAAEIYQRSPKWVFGLLAPVDLLGYSEMRFLDVQQNSGKLPVPLRIAILWEKTPHGNAFERGIVDFVSRSPRRRLAYEIVYDESFPPGFADAKALIGRLKQARADVFLADARLADFIALHREYVAARLCHAVVGYGARGSEKQAAEALGARNVEGILSAVWWNSEFAGEASNRAFLESWQKRHHRRPEWTSALGYESARALFTAVRNARSVDRARVREELVNLRMESIVPGGRLSFQNGQAQYPFVVQQNHADGASPVVYPIESAGAPAELTRCAPPLMARSGG